MARSSIPRKVSQRGERTFMALIYMQSCPPKLNRISGPPKNRTGNSLLEHIQLLPFMALFLYLFYFVPFYSTLPSKELRAEYVVPPHYCTLV